MRISFIIDDIHITGNFSYVLSEIEIKNSKLEIADRISRLYTDRQMQTSFIINGTHIAGIFSGVLSKIAIKTSKLKIADLISRL